jgi:hypothetical protein
MRLSTTFFLGWVQAKCADGGFRTAVQPARHHHVAFSSKASAYKAFAHDEPARMARAQPYCRMPCHGNTFMQGAPPVVSGPARVSKGDEQDPCAPAMSSRSGNWIGCPARSRISSTSSSRSRGRVRASVEDGCLYSLQTDLTPYLTDAAGSPTFTRDVHFVHKGGVS